MPIPDSLLPILGRHCVTTSIHERAAALILDAFLDYNARFSDITRRAKRRFERRDWKYAQVDANARSDLYDACLKETLGRLELLLEERIRSRPVWSATRNALARLVEPMLDREFPKTFFNSLSRRQFHTPGVSAEIEFLAWDSEPTAGVADAVDLRRYPVADGMRQVCARILADFPFANGYADIKACVGAIARSLRDHLQHKHASRLRMIELIPVPFFRERRAYLVGRAVSENGRLPVVIALVSTEQGVRADAVLTEVEQLSQLFSYARSYFHADLPTVADIVVFLGALLPHKPIEELYTLLGRIKQGKTERYRHLFRHLTRNPAERLVRADGARGMVMAVFAPRDYPLVFKVIRDRFAYPKDIARRQVEEKYRLVFRHDRVGRLLDAQEFRHLLFRRDQFEPDMLEELLGECAETVGLQGEQILVRHCYVQRKLRPMNLFVREAESDVAMRAMLDYGQAIKDMARSNIFPGDLLLKNFGISRGGRAIFYDYDELCLLDDCRFRSLPQAREEDETRPLEEWLSVRDGDVFPELFPRFLGVPGPLRDALVKAHPEIFDATWWQRIQAGLVAGAYADIAPYPASARLGHLPERPSTP